MFERAWENVRMTASQWFVRYGWFVLLSLFVPGLAAAPWLHFVTRDRRSRLWHWGWTIAAAAVAFGIVAYLLDRNGAGFFAAGAGMADVVVGLYICGAISTATVVLLTLLYALNPVLEVLFGILRIFD